MAKRLGQQTVFLEEKAGIVGYGAVVGRKEHEGPLGKEFDTFFGDNRLGEESFEKAESRLQTVALDTALGKAEIPPEKVDCIFAGDLLNQCIGSTFGLRSTERPVVGLYGACSTMTLALCTAATFLESGAANCVAAVTSSHFCAAERQYRFPLEYGNQRSPTAQWTATASGAFVLERGKKTAYIDRYCIGKIVDFGITDVNNMGAAMAPVSVKLRLQARGAEARPGLARRLFPLFSCSLLTGDSLPASAHFALRKNSAAQTCSL